MNKRAEKVFKTKTKMAKRRYDTTEGLWSCITFWSKCREWTSQSRGVRGDRARGKPEPNNGPRRESVARWAWTVSEASGFQMRPTALPSPDRSSSQAGSPAVPPRVGSLSGIAAHARSRDQTACIARSTPAREQSVFRRGAAGEKRVEARPCRHEYVPEHRCIESRRIQLCL